MPGTSIEIKNVSKIFGGKQRKSVVAVDDVSFSVAKGELVTLLGPADSGKSTVLKMIAGFEPPTKGEIFIGGKSSASIPPNQRKISLVRENNDPAPRKSIFAKLADFFFAKKKPDIDAETIEMMNKLGIAGTGDRSTGSLSCARMQLASLADVLGGNPSALLIDDLIGNIGAKMCYQLCEEIRRIQRKAGITCVYATQDRETALCISDRIILMNTGIIEQSGTPKEIYEKPLNRFVAGYLGKANFLPAEVEQVGGGNVTVNIFGRRFVVPQPEFANKPCCGAEAVLRPSAVTISTDGEGIPAIISRSVYMGGSVEYTVRAGEIDMQVSIVNPRISGQIPEGAQVRLSFDPASLHIITF